MRPSDYYDQLDSEVELDLADEDDIDLLDDGEEWNEDDYIEITTRDRSR